MPDENKMSKITKRPGPGRPKLPNGAVCSDKITIRVTPGNLADLRRLPRAARREITKRVKHHITKAIAKAKSR
jgi:hypothetical protein